MMMPRLTALALVLTFSGFPLGSLLCGRACAPPQAQTAPDCHGHGDGTAAGSVVTGIHLCDQDASVVPVIARPAFTLASAGTDAPYDMSSIEAMRLVPPAPVGVFPSEPQRSRVLTAEAVLRI
jgi:hypothetical protein